MRMVFEKIKKNTISLKTKLNAFQIRGLRHIPRIEHSYWSHATNLEMIARANMIADRAKNIEWTQFLISKTEKMMEIRLISNILEERKRRLLGDIIRTEHTDP